MKKIILLSVSVIFIFAVLAFAGVYTDTELTLNAPASAGGAPTGFKIKPSTKVTIGFLTSDTGYAVTAGHVNGDRTFGTSWDSQTIYWQAKNAGVVTTAPTSSSAGAFGGWNSL